MATFVIPDHTPTEISKNPVVVNMIEQKIQSFPQPLKASVVEEFNLIDVDVSRKIAAMRRQIKEIETSIEQEIEWSHSIKEKHVLRDKEVYDNLMGKLEIAFETKQKFWNVKLKCLCPRHRMVSEAYNRRYIHQQLQADDICGFHISKEVCMCPAVEAIVNDLTSKGYSPKHRGGHIGNNCHVTHFIQCYLRN